MCRTTRYVPVRTKDRRTKKGCLSLPPTSLLENQFADLCLTRITRKLYVGLTVGSLAGLDHSSSSLPSQLPELKAHRLSHLTSVLSTPVSLLSLDPSTPVNIRKNQRIRLWRCSSRRLHKKNLFVDIRWKLWFSLLSAIHHLLSVLSAITKLATGSLQHPCPNRKHLWSIRSATGSLQKMRPADRMEVMYCKFNENYSPGLLHKIDLLPR